MTQVRKAKYKVVMAALRHSWEEGKRQKKSIRLRREQRNVVEINRLLPTIRYNHFSEAVGN